jgi:TFIIF-interacting CTD phosphatase-like protein
LERRTADRLLKERKLSLLLDLDQTVIHATVDPSVKAWIQNSESSEYPKIQVGLSYAGHSQFHVGWSAPRILYKVTPKNNRIFEQITRKL